MLQTMNTLMEKYIAQVQKIYGSNLRKVILYGSYARGDSGPDSDVDLMILIDMSDLELKSYSQKLSYKKRSRFVSDTECQIRFE